MKYAFSDKRNITGAFPISSRRTTNTNWELFDIHDEPETLKYEVREVPKNFWKSKGREQDREPEERNEVSGGHMQVEEREGEPVEREESHEDKTLGQDEDNRDEQSKLRTVPELDQPTPVGIAPKPKVRKLKGGLSAKMLKESEDIMKVGDPRDSDIIIP